MCRTVLESQTLFFSPRHSSVSNAFSLVLLRSFCCFGVSRWEMRPLQNNRVTIKTLQAFTYLIPVCMCSWLSSLICPSLGNCVNIYGVFILLLNYGVFKKRRAGRCRGLNPLRDVFIPLHSFYMNSFQTFNIMFINGWTFRNLCHQLLYYKKIAVILKVTCFKRGCTSFLLLISVTRSSFVQRPVRRQRTASSVPSRSLWRRSSKLRGFGRARATVRGSVWTTRSRAAGAHVEDTVPYPETGPKQTSTKVIGTTTEQEQREKGVRRMDSAVCTPFWPSSVTAFCLDHEWMKGSCENTLLPEEV